MMLRQMYTSVWILSMITLLVLDLRSGALEDKDIVPRRCYQCSPVSSTSCELSVQRQLVCSPKQPYCATTSIAPSFASTLGCSAPSKNPCTLISTPQKFAFSCVCSNDLCNTPFSKIIQHELHNLYVSNASLFNNATNHVEDFLKSTNIANISQTLLYKYLTSGFVKEPQFTTSAQNALQVTVLVTTPSPYTSNLLKAMNGARAEAQKQMPSDDDEDDSEGSGYEEMRSDRKPIATSPERPSSLLPASENDATCLSLNLVYLYLFFYYCIISNIM